MAAVGVQQQQPIVDAMPGHKMFLILNTNCITSSSRTDDDFWCFPRGIECSRVMGENVHNNFEHAKFNDGVRGGGGNSIEYLIAYK